MTPEKVIIYDTTLRDGAQSEGIAFSTEDKLEILKKLDSFGVSFAEGGWPGANPKDDEFFRQAGGLKLSHTALAAFGSTAKHGTPPGEDRNLISLASCSAEWCCIFGKSWDFQVEKALCIPLEDNLIMIRDSVRFLRDSGKRVMFDAEHFFDGYRSDRSYAMKALSAAAEGGAEWLVLCDTNGGTMTCDIASAVEDVVLAFDVPVGIHCHNDSDLAVANSIAAVESGASMVQGTINGIGERCGNANLCSVIANLSLKLGYDIDVRDVSMLAEVSEFVGETANAAPSPSLPYVGEKAFAHKGGIHVSAMSKDPRTYEHIPPEAVGNRRRILISDMAGKASISEKLKEFGIDADAEESRIIVGRIKEMEAEGYQFEGADASFELLVRRLRGEMEPPFRVTGFRVFIDDAQEKTTSEASVKVEDSNGIEEHTASNGDGPVNALDNALRKALSRFFPVVKDIRLTDYKVRVLDGTSATAATVRVLIRSTNGKNSWTTVGVSENVIEASLDALTDSIEYAIYKDRREVNE
ncbi:MAG: citramalate synthase [Candidatus Methanoplasma sp.]|jgi:2-isopropylmalate synthase|nr:citramalate synthase [Candidatus Methanoplasma sp.]